MKDFSFVTGPTPEYIESLYNDFTKDPSTVDPEWKKFFEGFDFAISSNTITGATSGGQTPSFGGDLDKEMAVFELIRAYRKRGHLAATTNPIRARKDRHAQLELNRFNLSDADLEKTYFAGRFVGMKDAKIPEYKIHRPETLWPGRR